MLRVMKAWRACMKKKVVVKVTFKHKQWAACQDNSSD